VFVCTKVFIGVHMCSVFVCLFEREVFTDFRAGDDRAIAQLTPY
jgi:hypothetical protein